MHILYSQNALFRSFHRVVTRSITIANSISASTRRYVVVLTAASSATFGVLVSIQQNDMYTLPWRYYCTLLLLLLCIMCVCTAEKLYGYIENEGDGRSSLHCRKREWHLVRRKTCNLHNIIHTWFFTSEIGLLRTTTSFFFFYDVIIIVIVSSAH